MLFPLLCKSITRKDKFRKKHKWRPFGYCTRNRLYTDMQKNSLFALWPKCALWNVHISQPLLHLEVLGELSERARCRPQMIQSRCVLTPHIPQITGCRQGCFGYKSRAEKCTGYEVNPFMGTSHMRPIPTEQKSRIRLIFFSFTSDVFFSSMVAFLERVCVIL